MQNLVELISSLKQLIYSRLARSAPARQCASGAVSVAAAGASLQGTPADSSDMQILFPRPPAPAMPAVPTPPPPNFNYNRELVPYPEDNYSETKELLKVSQTRLTAEFQDISFRCSFVCSTA